MRAWRRPSGNRKFSALGVDFGGFIRGALSHPERDQEGNPSMNTNKGQLVGALEESVTFLEFVVVSN